MRMPKLPTKIYCDGGLIGPTNPSVVGGTWAWCWVDENDCLLEHDSGFVTPTVMEVVTKVVTNNQTELLAAVRALESARNAGIVGWSGTLCADSLVTLYRVTDGEAFRGIPPWLDVWARKLRERRKYKVELIGGHPTKKELLAGRKRKNGLRVSHWNVFCDGLCRKEAEKFLSTSRA